MELTFSELRAKEVINVVDGRKLGKACDVVLCYPENRWIGLVVPNKSGFSFKKNGLFIDLKNIVKIGEDVILVNVGSTEKPSEKPSDKRPCSPCQANRPPVRPSDYPPTPPPYPPNNRNGFSTARSFEDYE